LVALTKRIASGKASDSMRSSEFLRRLDAWAARELERKPRNRPRVQDKVSALSALAAEHSTLGSMRKHLLKLYVNPEDQSRPAAQCHLSTIHKAKGREWPSVLFLDPFLLPAKWAEQEWEKQQESNLAYVGITRAQRILHYCTSEHIQ
jgi:superfamily I DNA/RNA helicase